MLLVRGSSDVFAPLLEFSLILLQRQIRSLEFLYSSPTFEDAYTRIATVCGGAGLRETYFVQLT
jgi:hypothetical protein